MFTRCQNLIAKVLHTSHPLSKITEPPVKGVRINYHSSVLWSIGVKIQISLYISPSSGLFFISPDEDLLFEVETSRVNFLVSFNSDDQRNTDVATTADVTTYASSCLLGHPSMSHLPDQCQYYFVIGLYSLIYCNNTLNFWPFQPLCTPPLLDQTILHSATSQWSWL